MHATLYSRGHLLIGPSKFRFVPTGQSLETAMQALLDEENTNRIGAEVEAIDVQTREMFDKQWCGPIDLSAEGVAAMEDWDTAFAKLQAKKVAAIERKALNVELDSGDTNPAGTVSKVIEAARVAPI